MAGHGHVESVETKIGIIVVEIRDPFFFTLFCSQFAYIMSGGGKRWIQAPDLRNSQR